MTSDSQFNTNNKEYILKITSALYRVTEIFPEGEPLKFSIREKANDILSETIILSGAGRLANLRQAEQNKIFEQVKLDISVMMAYFELAKKQEWVKEENFFVLGSGYKIMQAMIDSMMDSYLSAESAVVKRSGNPANKLKDRRVRKIAYEGDFFKSSDNERQKKILETLKDRDAVQVKDIQAILPPVSKRTLRRDFDHLLDGGVVERVGNGNLTFYRLKR